jgi:hypothetical protein
MFQILQVSRRQQAKLEARLRHARLLSQSFYGCPTARRVRPRTPPSDPEQEEGERVPPPLQHLPEQQEAPEAPAVNNKYLIIHPAYM